METLAEYAWIVPIIMLSWICYRLWKRGKYRDPGQENTYHAATKNQTQFPQYQCPDDIENKDCQYYNRATGHIDGVINCNECSWYNSGIRPSKF